MDPWYVPYAPLVPSTPLNSTQSTCAAVSQSAERVAIVVLDVSTFRYRRDSKSVPSPDPLDDLAAGGGAAA